MIHVLDNLCTQMAHRRQIALQAVVWRGLRDHTEGPMCFLAGIFAEGTGTKFILPLFDRATCGQESNPSFSLRAPKNFDLSGNGLRDS